MMIVNWCVLGYPFIMQYDNVYSLCAPEKPPPDKMPQYSLTAAFCNNVYISEHEWDCDQDFTRLFSYTNCFGWASYVSSCCKFPVVYTCQKLWKFVGSWHSYCNDKHGALVTAHSVSVWQMLTHYCMTYFTIYRQSRCPILGTLCSNGLIVCVIIIYYTGCQKYS